MNALTADGLGKNFGRKRAIHDCTFALPAGRVVAVVGPNGAGKTTLLSLLAGLLRPTRGSISVHGTPIGRRIHPDVAFLAQHRPLYPAFTVAEMMRAGAGMNERWSGRRANEVLGLLSGVDQDTKIGRLSAGERAQVALALALGRLPKVLLLDEPLSALDPLARDETMRILMAEVAERGTTVLMSSHLLGELNAVCDHILLLAEGTVALGGDIDELLADHQMLVGPATAEGPAAETVVFSSDTGRQTTAIVRGSGPVPAGWDNESPDLEALVMAYLRAARERRQTR